MRKKPLAEGKIPLPVVNIVSPILLFIIKGLAFILLQTLFHSLLFTKSPLLYDYDI